ncbi:MAG: DMT family transporter [Pedobacter sp.]|nr:MAG: DMT family transporter [Pedobacter sp.]
MIYILLSICCSVIVGILLKLAKRYEINVKQAITFNYLAAIALSYFFFKPALTTVALPVPLFIALGILLPFIFWCLSSSVKNYGIVKTDIAQRLSLFIPLVAAWLLFNEHISLLKVAGFIIGLIAVVLILNRNREGEQTSGWLFPILVFVGFGVIDVLFKQVAKITAIPYTTALFYIFICAFTLSMIWLIVMLITGKQKFQLVNFFAGCFLGLFNFANILFYLKAHRIFSENPSTVFASMNLGVIVLGTLVGLLIFKEKLNKANYAGLFMAIIAVVLITVAQIYAV